MKTKLFDKNLFFEGLHQLKTAGLICFLISIVGNILSFIFVCIIKYISYLNNEDFLENLFSMSVSGANKNGALFFDSISCGATSIYVFTPIFTFLLFKFLFKRNASDFYHSLSVKRETLFFTFSLSALVMSLSIVAVCGLFSIITNGFVLNILDFSSVLPNFLNIVAGCLLIQSIITIGCAVSGRFFASLVASAMIAFYPRIFITALLYTIKLSNPVIDPAKFDMPLGNSYNVLTGAMFENYMEYKSVIYSVVLAAIYYYIAVRFFKNRHSENARVAGTAKQIKAPMRIAFCMIFCLPAIIIEYLMLTQNYDTDTNLTLIIPILILYFFAIVSYFLIELFSQGKYKNFGKIVLQFGWVILLNILLLGGLYVTREVVVNYQPDPQKIESVNIRPVGDFYESLYNYDYHENPFDTEEFFDNCQITDKQTIVDICEIYNKADGKVYDTLNKITIGFKQGNTTKYRVISLTDKSLERLAKFVEIDDEFVKSITIIPENIERVTVSYEEFSDSNPMLVNLYETAVEEIKSYSDGELFKKVYNSVNTYGAISNINCYDDKGNKYVVPFIEDEMHKTRIAYYQAKAFEVSDKTYKELEYSLTHPYKEMDEDYYNDRYVYCEYAENGFYCEYDFKEHKTKELFEYIKTEGKVYKKGKYLFSINYDFCRKPDKNSQNSQNNDRDSIIEFDVDIVSGESQYCYGDVYFFIDQEHIDEYFELLSKHRITKDGYLLGEDVELA